MGLRDFKSHIFSYRTFHDCPASNSRLTSSREMVLGKNCVFFKKSHRGFRECLAPSLRPIASRESVFASVVLFVTVSQLTCYSITRENRVFSIFYVADVTCFQIISTSLAQVSRTSFHPNHYFIQTPSFLNKISTKSLQGMCF